MIYRPADRTEAQGRRRTARELAAVLVALSLFLAFILQFACAGADPVGDRWLCPNNARLARLAARTPTVEAGPTATPGAGAAIWTPRPDVAPTVQQPIDAFGADEFPFVATPSLADPFGAFATPVSPRPIGGGPTEAPVPTPIDAFVAPPPDDRTSAILGTATALSATATARLQRAQATETPDEPLLEATETPEATPTGEDGGYP